MATYFSGVIRYLGERRTYVLAISAYLLLWVIFPVTNLCARHFEISTSVWTGIVLWVVLKMFADMAFGSFFFFLSFMSLGTDSTFRLYQCIHHCCGTEQAFSGSNPWSFADGYCDSAHCSPLIFDVSLFLLCGTQSSWRLCSVRRFIVHIVLRSVACNVFAS